MRCVVRSLLQALLRRLVRHGCDTTPSSELFAKMPDAEPDEEDGGGREHEDIGIEEVEPDPLEQHPARDRREVAHRVDHRDRLAPKSPHTHGVVSIVRWT